MERRQTHEDVLRRARLQHNTSMKIQIGTMPQSTRRTSLVRLQYGNDAPSLDEDAAPECAADCAFEQFNTHLAESALALSRTLVTQKSARHCNGHTFGRASAATTTAGDDDNGNAPLAPLSAEEVGPTAGGIPCGGEPLFGGHSRPRRSNAFTAASHDILTPRLDADSPATYGGMHFDLADDGTTARPGDACGGPAAALFDPDGSAHSAGGSNTGQACTRPQHTVELGFPASPYGNGCVLDAALLQSRRQRRKSTTDVPPFAMKQSSSRRFDTQLGFDARAAVNGPLSPTASAASILYSASHTGYLPSAVSTCGGGVAASSGGNLVGNSNVSLSGSNVTGNGADTTLPDGSLPTYLEPVGSGPRLEGTRGRFSKQLTPTGTLGVGAAATAGVAAGDGQSAYPWTPSRAKERWMAAAQCRSPGWRPRGLTLLNSASDELRDGGGTDDEAPASAPSVLNASGMRYCQQQQQQTAAPQQQVTLQPPPCQPPLTPRCFGSATQQGHCEGSVFCPAALNLSVEGAAACPQSPRVLCGPSSMRAAPLAPAASQQSLGDLATAASTPAATCAGTDWGSESSASGLFSPSNATRTAANTASPLSAAGTPVGSRKGSPHGATQSAGGEYASGCPTQGSATVSSSVCGGAICTASGSAAATGCAAAGDTSAAALLLLSRVAHVQPREPSPQEWTLGLPAMPTDATKTDGGPRSGGSAGGANFGKGYSSSLCRTYPYPAGVAGNSRTLGGAVGARCGALPTGAPGTDAPGDLPGPTLPAGTEAWGRAGPNEAVAKSPSGPNSSGTISTGQFRPREVAVVQDAPSPHASAPAHLTACDSPAVRTLRAPATGQLPALTGTWGVATNAATVTPATASNGHLSAPSGPPLRPRRASVGFPEDRSVGSPPGVLPLRSPSMTGPPPLLGCTPSLAARIGGGGSTGGVSINVGSAGGSPHGSLAPSQPTSPKTAVLGLQHGLQHHASRYGSVDGALPTRPPWEAGGVAVDGISAPHSPASPPPALSSSPAAAAAAASIAVTGCGNQSPKSATGSASPSSQASTPGRRQRFAGAALLLGHRDSSRRGGKLQEAGSSQTPPSPASPHSPLKVAAGFHPGPSAAGLSPQPSQEQPAAVTPRAGISAREHASIWARMEKALSSLREK